MNFIKLKKVDCLQQMATRIQRIVERKMEMKFIDGTSD